jgi:hypothetical protein
MAIELAGAIGLGGKRPSILTGLGETIGKIGGDISEGIQRNQAAQAVAQRKEQEKSDMVIDYWNKKLNIENPGDVYNQDWENQLRPFINERLNELTKMQIEGKGSSFINAKGVQFANEISDKIGIAKKDFNTGAKLGKYFNNPDEYETEEARQSWAERLNKPLEERAKDVDFVETDITQKSIFPKPVSLEKEIKEINPSFDLGETFVKEIVVDGSNRYKIDEKGLADIKSRVIDDFVNGRMSKYQKSLMRQAEIMTRDTNPPDYNENDTPEQFAQKKQTQVLNAMGSLFDRDWNTIQDEAIKKATNKRTIRTESEYGSGRYSGSAGSTNFVQGVGGSSVGDVTNEINKINFQIKHFDIAIDKIKKEQSKVEGSENKLQHKNKINDIKTERKKAEDKIKELEEKKKGFLIQGSDKIHLSMKSRPSFVLTDEQGKQVKGVSATDVLFDKVNGTPIGILGVYGSGKNQQEEIFPLTDDSNGMRNAAELIVQFKQRKDDFIGHLKKIKAPESHIEGLNRLISRMAKDDTKAKSEKDYGTRPDGTKKGSGFLGEIKTKDGKVMTEKTASIDFGVGEMDIPLIVNGLSKEEIDVLASGKKPTKTIIDKAVNHAKKRMSEGLSPYENGGELKSKSGKPIKLNLQTMQYEYK